MLVQLGKRPEASDIVDLLLECHQRIRKFLSISRSLATTPDADPAQTKDAAAQVRRYFAESLPMHVADEQEQVLPRLVSASPDIARALATMTEEHDTHAPLVEQLVAVCDRLVEDPRQAAAVSAELTQIVDKLTQELEPHLEAEERVIFPALRRLPSEQRDEILVAMRERRARALG
ncbi:MAG TPA: hemerythrin domain-containing protein [Kofleriaceae bacterium]